jgi:hypothetical protein
LESVVHVDEEVEMEKKVLKVPLDLLEMLVV